jgi:predicted transglutaminase-like cysteine proteinase
MKIYPNLILKERSLLRRNTTETDLIKEQERVVNVAKNRRTVAIGVDELKLLMALIRSWTEETYGHVDFCHKQKKMCQQKSHKRVWPDKNEDYDLMDIAKALNNVQSILDLEHADLIKLKH